MTNPLNNSMNMVWACIGLHLIADYVLQGVLADLKQKSWWHEHVIKKIWEEYSENTYEWRHRVWRKYEFDYLIGLYCHALMWSIVTFFPLMWFCSPGAFTVLINVNTLMHLVVDHMKANIHCINLIEDQLIHLAQVIATVLITFAVL